MYIICTIVYNAAIFDNNFVISILCKICSMFNLHPFTADNLLYFL